jgi:hypothetical protein
MDRMNDLSLSVKEKFLTLKSFEIPGMLFSSLPELLGNAQKMTACPKTARN